MEDKNLHREVSEGRSLLREKAFLFGVKGDDKIEKFEKMLSGGLKLSDNVGEAMGKLVEAAISAEFGEEMLDKKFAKAMVGTITRSLMSDNELRKQALLIIDRFAKPDEINA